MKVVVPSTVRGVASHFLGIVFSERITFGLMRHPKSWHTGRMSGPRGKTVSVTARTRRDLVAAARLPFGAIAADNCTRVLDKSSRTKCQDAAAFDFEVNCGR